MASLLKEMSRIYYFMILVFLIAVYFMLGKVSDDVDDLGIHIDSLVESTNVCDSIANYILWQCDSFKIEMDSLLLSTEKTVEQCKK